MSKYLIVFEKTETGYSAYCPDLPGCAATGSDMKEAEKNIFEAVEMHLEGLIEDDLPFPEPRAFSEYFEYTDHSQQAA